MTEKKEEKENILEDRRRCLNCSSVFGYYRIKKKEFVCRSCGFIEKAKKGEVVKVEKEEDLI